MAGSSSTITYDDGADGAGLRGRIRKVLIDFVTDASDGTCVITTRKIVGRLIKLVTDPGGTAPTDNYDVAITDAEGVNVLAGIQNATALGTRDTANTEETYLHLLNADLTPIAMAAYPVVCDVLTISIANAGNSKTGQVILYYEV